jgi:DNA-binding NtrC family response regulator
MTETENNWILVLDDEPLITQTLEALLADEDSWSIAVFNNPLEAKASLDVRSYRVVITDFLMPQMDGISFLKEVRERQPTASRILLTGYADKQNAIRSINEVGLYHYIEKPWDNQQLLLIIRNGIERAGLIEELQERMKQMTEQDRSMDELRDRLLKAIL